MTDPSPSLATPYRTHTAGQLRAADAGTEARLAGWVHRRRDHGQLIFLDLRDRHGITQVVVDKADAPDAHATASRVRSEFVIAVARHRREATAGHGEPAAPDRRDRAPDDRVRDPVRGEDHAVLHQRARRAGRRGPAAEVPLPRYPPPAHGRPPAAPQPHGPGDPRGPPRQRLRRGRDADAHQEHARRRARLHRAEPAPARQRVRPPTEPAAAQAAADGGRHRPLLPDRPLLSRRGPARRPAAGIHPARPGDELRRRRDRDGLHRGDGHRRLERDHARAPAPAGPVPALHVRRGDRALRQRQAGRAVRDGARRSRAGVDAGFRVQGVRRGAGSRRAGQGDRRARAWPASRAARSTS